MYQIMVPNRHKLLVVFDKDNDLIAYYSLSKLIGCPPDKNIHQCSSIFIYENIECFENYFWNPVSKKCQCILGYFLDQKT